MVWEKASYLHIVLGDGSPNRRHGLQGYEMRGEENNMTAGQTLKADSSPKSKVSREEALRKIREQIEIGRAIKDAKMFSMMDLDSAQERRTEWLENQTQMFTLLFNDSFLLEENRTDISSDIDSAITFGLKEKYFKDDINQQIGKLESLLERLKLQGEEGLKEELMRQEQPKELLPEEVQLGARPVAEKPSRVKLTRREPLKEPPSIEKPPRGEAPKEASMGKRPFREERTSSMISNQSQLTRSNILLIHGQDGTAKRLVLEFIEKQGLRALIPDEQVNEGEGFIEKFRDLANIHFAIVLFTPNDATTSQDKPGGRRARLIQDIIFEFGYLVGKLGQERVCALCQGGAKISFDHSGAVSIPMDSRGGWRLLVAKEIKQAGIEIDLNKAI
jgi:predicted nucleotide-binding protein